MRTFIAYITVTLLALTIAAEKAQAKEAEKSAEAEKNIAIIDTGFNLNFDGSSINICKNTGAHISYFNCRQGNIYIVLDSQAVDAGWIMRTVYSVNVKTKTKKVLASLQMPRSDNKTANYLLDLTSGSSQKVFPGGLLPSTNWIVIIACFMMENEASFFDYLNGNVVYTTLDKGMTVYDKAAKKIRKINIKEPKENKYIFPYFSDDAGRVAYVHSRNFRSTEPSTDIMFYDLAIQKYIKRIQTFDVLQSLLSANNKKALTVYCRHIASRSTATVKDYTWLIEIIDLDTMDSQKITTGINACWLN